MHLIVAHLSNGLHRRKANPVNSRSKKVLATTGAALVAVLLPTGCGLELVPGLIGSTTIGGAATGGAVGGGVGGVIPSAMVP